MVEESFIIKMEDSMMESGKIIEWKDLEHFIISPIIKPMKECGLMISFMEKENSLTTTPSNSKISSISTASIKSMNIGTTTKVIDS